MLVALKFLVVICGVALALHALSRARRRVMLELRTDNACGIRKDDLDEWPEMNSLLGRFIRPHSRTQTAVGQWVTQSFPVILIVALAMLLFLVGWRATLLTGVSGLLGYIYLARWLERKRAQMFSDRLPPFLERVRRLILIGNTFQQAFVQASLTADPVIRERIDPVVRRVQHGAPFTDSIDALAQRIDTAELHLLAAYVRTNAKFGGRVAQNLQNLLNQISNKARLEREIKAATSETRASALVLIGLTVLVIGLMSILNPAYIQFFLGDKIGRIVLSAICVWPLVGLVVMRRITTLQL